MAGMGRLITSGLVVSVVSVQAGAIQIVVDYTYDTNNFFATQASRDAMQAVADRYSAIITSSLSAVGPGGTATGTDAGWRIGFTHPGTGASWQVSTAANVDADPFKPFFDGNQRKPADVYGFAGLSADQWILYAGGRPLGSAGQGGTGTGLNFSETFDDPNGPTHRGLMPVDGGNSVNDLPVWGGSITFDTGRSWDFALDSAGNGGSDFYSIALHEVGHALGLNTSWNQWQNWQSGNQYIGPEALAAYNADNNTAVTWLNQVNAGNTHWQDGAYDSFIFPLANPNYNGTVGAGYLQDLLMEPTANFVSPGLQRFEITNVDVATLRDLGWDTLSALPGDTDGDGDIDDADLGTLISNFTGPIGAAGGKTAAQGDTNGDGDIDDADIANAISGFTGPLSPANVPEPSSLALVLAGGLLARRRRR